MNDIPDPRTLRRLRRAIRRLPQDQHAVFCAVRYEDLDYEQVAERTGLTVREVEKLLAQALFAIMRDMDRVPRRRWWRLW
jgi:RNA polymerase sigma-70 factor (ECF subfamily)